MEFAYCIPYTYTRLWRLIDKIEKHPHYKYEKLCNSLSGVEVPLLTITDFEDKKIPVEKRKIIVISARVHPGESNGSWMMEGYLKFLLSSHQNAIKLRKK